MGRFFVSGSSPRLDLRASALPGLSVAEAADYLGVSEPTVRAWIRRGILLKVPRTRPILVERSSLRTVHRAIGELRRRGEDRDWLRALVDLLHDRSEQGRPELLRGMQELERGQLEPA